MKNPDGSLSPDEIGKIGKDGPAESAAAPAGAFDRMTFGVDPSTTGDRAGAVSYVLHVGARRDSFAEFLNQRTVDEMRGNINAAIGGLPDEIVFKRHRDPPPETPREKFKRQLLQYLKEKRDRDGSL